MTIPPATHAAGARTGRPLPGWLRRQALRRTPASWVYLVVLLATTVFAGLEHGPAEQRLLEAVSTNLHNMTSHPVMVLVLSAFWVGSSVYLGPMLLLVVTIMAAAERSIGTARTLLAFTFGHVGATLATVLGIAVAVARGWLPQTLDYATDVGPSYGLAALCGVVVVRLPGGRCRTATLGVMLAGLVVMFAADPDFTAVGHLIATMLGLGLGVFLGRGRRQAVDEATDVVV